MKLRDMMLVALFAAVTAALGLLPPIPLPFTPVPITAQTLGVMLAGSILGARLGGLSILIFVILIAVGAPVLPGGRGGWPIFLLPNGGYILSWPIAAFIVGLLVERLAKQPKFWPILISNIVGGILVIYAVGVPYHSFIANLPLKATALPTLAYVPGDLVKAVLAAVVAARVRRLLPLLNRSAEK
jgi:biotin transport system substrate-specific component